MTETRPQTPLDPNKPSDNHLVIKGFLNVQQSNDPFLVSLKVDVPHDPKKWDKSDLIKLATTHGGVAAFDALTFLSAHASERVAGKPTEKAMEARGILKQYRAERGFFTQFLPGTIETDVDDFIKDIKAVDRATRDHPVRVDMHQPMDRGPKFPAVKLKVGAIHTDRIRFSDEQQVQTPQFDEAALAAVKSKKASNSIT